MEASQAPKGQQNKAISSAKDVIDGESSSNFSFGSRLLLKKCTWSKNKTLASALMALMKLEVIEDRANNRYSRRK